tara:strand:- start:2715 stop:3458 length:744 start_codon:yes stop_codon:yes gene_type:complete
LKIELKNISFEPSKKVVIKNVNLEIRNGITTLLGQNGSGKTTLMKLMCNIIFPSSGEILINNDNIKKISRNQLARTISYVSQDRENLQGFTVYEYTEMGRFPYQNFIGLYDDISKEIIDDSLKNVNMYSRKDEYVNNLSGGEMQILRIARSLAQDVNLIMFDEPTSNLDINNTQIVKNLILDLKNKGKNIIISTHDINFARSLSDYIFMIKKGEIFNHGITSNVLTNKNIIDCYELEKFGNLDFIIS